MTPMPTEQIREAIRQELQPLREQVERIDYAIRGNGVPGLNQRVALLEDARKTNHSLWMTVSAVLLALLGAVATAVATKII